VSIILPGPGMHSFVRPAISTIYGMKPGRFRLVVFKMDLPEAGKDGRWYE
jgi:hypothetical protein